MGMQVSCSVPPERAEERVAWEDTEVFGAGVSRIGLAEEESDRSRANACGPCAYADQHTAEVCGGRGDRVYQGQECDRAIARQFGGRKRNFSGERFWARSYAVSTVGFEEEKVRYYIRQQEQFDKKGSMMNRTMSRLMMKLMSKVHFNNL
jgi:hypothetical protein